MKWTTEQLLDHPNFGKLVLKNEHTENNHSWLCSSLAKPVGRLPLDNEGEAKEAHWYFPAKRFEVTYTIYSIRPADFDGIDIKFLQDFCVKAGIIPDDKWSVLSGRVCSKKAATEAEEKTEIEILAI